MTLEIVTAGRNFASPFRNRTEIRRVVTRTGCVHSLIQSEARATAEWCRWGGLPSK